MFVRVSVKRDRYFQRDESGDIHVEVPISIGQAVLGGVADVRTVLGDVELRIPKGTQPGTKLLMRGKGGVGLSGKTDQICHLKLTVPRSLTESQAALLQAFQDDVDGKKPKMILMHADQEVEEENEEEGDGGAQSDSGGEGAAAASASADAKPNEIGGDDIEEKKGKGKGKGKEEQGWFSGLFNKGDDAEDDDQDDIDARGGAKGKRKRKTKNI